jgi:hypothetical protein
MNQSSSYDHETPDQGEHHGGEDYPRLELNRLIGASQAETRVRRSWQAILLSIGLILVALGLPTERYFGGLESVWQLAGSGPTPQGLMALPILATHALFSIGLESSCFLWSAILYGSSLFLLMRLMYRIGFVHEVGLAATLIALAAPIAWLGGTLPLDFSAGLFGSTLLCTSLFQTDQKANQGYLWRASSYLLLAFMLHPENIWLAPAAIWAVSSQAKNRDQGRVNAFGLSVVSVVCLWVSVTVGGGPWSELWNSVMGTSPGSLTVISATVFWFAGLGAAWFGLGHLLLGRREAEEQPAPTWVLAWIAVGIAPLIAGGLDQGPRGAFLLPIAAIGVADWLTRRILVEHRSRWAALLVAGQLGLTVGSMWMLGQGDPHRAWSTAAHTHLAKDDLLVSPSAPHAYLARFRQGISSFQIDDEGTPILGSKLAQPLPVGLVLDGWDATPLPAPNQGWVDAQLPPIGPQRRPTKALTKEGMIPASQVP